MYKPHKSRLSRFWKQWISTVHKANIDIFINLNDQSKSWSTFIQVILSICRYKMTSEKQQIESYIWYKLVQA